jgi:hypothetical protein
MRSRQIAPSTYSGEYGQESGPGAFSGPSVTARETLVASLLLLELLDQDLSLPTPVTTGKSFPPTVPMRSLLESAGFFFETPVPVLPSVHPLVPSLLRS